MLNLGNYATGSPVYVPFSTSLMGVPITMTGLAVGDIKIYKDGGIVQRASTSGFTLLDTDGTDFDGLTGLHGVSIDTSDNTTAGFFAAGSEYWVAIDAVTVDGETIRFWAAIFSLQNRFMRGTDSAALATSVPAALVGGRMDSSVGAMAASVLTATAIAANAITSAKIAASAIGASQIATGALTAAKFAAGAFDAVWSVTVRVLTAATNLTTALATPTNITAGTITTVGSVTGAVGSVTGAVGSVTGHTNQSGDSFARLGAAGAGLTAIPWNASWDPEVESEVNDALVVQKLDHLVAVADADDPVDNSIIAKLAAKAATANWSDYNNTTDSLEARADTHGYGVILNFIDDDNGSADLYQVVFVKDGETIVSGVTSPTIQVIKSSDGTDLIASVALTQVAATGLYKRSEASNRVVDGEGYIAKITATIDGSSRTDYAPFGKDNFIAGVNVTQINGSSAAAIRHALAAGQMIPGTVDDSIFTPLDTAFEASDITVPSDDHFGGLTNNGRLVLWTTGTLTGQVALITDYALSGSNGKFTVEQMTEAPLNGDTFILV